jgi:hypothetical protein
MRTVSTIGSNVIGCDGIYRSFLALDCEASLAPSDIVP